MPVVSKRPRAAASGLPVYVCEYHDEALRCLHDAIRRRYAPFDGLTMVHLDAHPDLGASASMPAEIIFKSPHDVYQALRADLGGIAQWILPAVYGGHLDCVWWVRPHFAEQIADGEYNVKVGRAARAPEDGNDGIPVEARRAFELRGTDARRGPDISSGNNATLENSIMNGKVESPETIRISCAQPYFVEDGLYCSADDLVASSIKPLRLLVSTLHTDSASPLVGSQGRTPEASIAWTLDVCLDFFACGNPFLSQVRQEIAAPFAAVHYAVTFRKGEVVDVPGFLAKRDEFDLAYNAVLRNALDSTHDADDDADDDDLLNSLGIFLPEEERASLLANLDNALEKARDSELQQILEAGDMVTLPLHQVCEAELRQQFVEFEKFLRCLNSSIGSPPAVVTVARSVVDGFCPMRWHCFLERGVLDVLEKCWGALAITYSDELNFLENT